MAMRVTLDLPKFHTLQATLGLTKYQTLGLLETMWHMTAKTSPRGDLGKHTNKAIASWIGWEGDCDQLIAALVETGWLDTHSEHRLIVHDWHQHADKSLKTSLKNRGELFVTPEKQDAKLTPIPKQMFGTPTIENGPLLGLGLGLVPSNGIQNELTAESVASEYWFQLPGTYKPLLEDITAEFIEKVRVNGPGILPGLLARAQDPKRDKTQKLWEFWRDAGLGSKTSKRDPPPPKFDLDENAIESLRNA